MILKSPCIDVCRIDSRTRWCAGCGRTVEEIKSRQKMTPYRQRAVLADLDRRLSHLATVGGAPDADLHTDDAPSALRRA